MGRAEDGEREVFTPWGSFKRWVHISKLYPLSRFDRLLPEERPLPILDDLRDFKGIRNPSEVRHGTPEPKVGGSSPLGDISHCAARTCGDNCRGNSFLFGVIHRASAPVAEGLLF